MNTQSHTAHTLARSSLVLVLALGACVAEDPATTAAAHEVTGAPILLPWSGTGQDREVTSSFDPLAITLHDTFGQPIAGANVQFTSPATGASAWFKFAGLVQTDATGRAEIQAYANAIAGTYLVHAHVEGADPIPFVLTNTAGAPALAMPISGTAQARVFGMPFPHPLAVEVHDSYGNLVADAPVRFVAPPTGATMRTFADGLATSYGLATTDASGRAQILAIAGDIAGSYTVTAEIVGAPPVPFVLTNLAPRPPGSIVAADVAMPSSGTFVR